MAVDIEMTLAALKRHRMQGYFLRTREEVLPLLAALAPKGANVAWGDSETLEALGIYAFFRASGGYTALDKHAPGLSREEKRKIYLASFGADVFLTGVNAITGDGKLFNIDGNGSRVAPMLYGPGRVIVVAGTNKLVKDVDAAIHRARQVAAPLDARRLGKHTPCATFGRCVDCGHEERICNDFVLIAGQLDADRIKVVLVDEVLGY